MSDYDGGFRDWCEKFFVVWNFLQDKEEKEDKNRRDNYYSYKYPTIEDCMRCHLVQTVFELSKDLESREFESPEEGAIYANDILKKTIASYKDKEKRN